MSGARGSSVEGSLFPFTGLSLVQQDKLMDGNTHPIIAIGTIFILTEPLHLVFLLLFSTSRRAKFVSPRYKYKQT